MTQTHDNTGVQASTGPHSIGRRRFIGYLIGGATVMAAVDLGMLGGSAEAKVPSLPQIFDTYDLTDLLTDATRPTANLITVVINEDGTASFELPRSENGQGVTTGIAMLIAEELDLPLEKVKVTLAPARQELIWNQITGGSNTIHAMFTPVRVAAAIAKGALLQAAANLLGGTVDELTSKDGVVTAANGATATYAELAKPAAALTTKKVEVTLKDAREFTLIGKPRNRVDALAAVTGTKKFAMDYEHKGAMPTMVCRAPTMNGTPVALRNKAEILEMPGVTHVAKIPTGIAVRAKTFGQCIDAIQKMDVEWKDGPVAGESDEDIVSAVKAAELPMAPLPNNPLSKTIAADFTFYFRSNAPLDPISAVADIKEDGGEIWAALKNPIVAQQRMALDLGFLPTNLKVNVVEGGGSFGHRLFWDAASDAAHASKAMGVPVRLMWHRADEPRAGRLHPLCTSRVRASYVGKEVLAFQQSHTSVETDWRHGFGEIVTSLGADLPEGLSNLSYSQLIYTLTSGIPYDFGVLAQTMNETDTRFNTSAMRNVYSPDVRTASELVVDQLAKAMHKDPLEFRKEFLRNERLKPVLDKVAEVAEWGKPMPPGTAQGIAVHYEYKGVSACVMEIDCRPETVNRKVRDAYTGPRITRATMVIEIGQVVNPRSVEAQMQGCINDGIAMTLSSSVHLKNGHFLEASWDNYAYTRQWNTPPEVKVVIMPGDSAVIGGVGEAGVATAAAAAACAYARATGKMPTEFPINHNEPIFFEPKSFIPPVPQSPTDGLRWTY